MESQPTQDLTADAAPFSPDAIARAQNLLEKMPDRIGRYRILERIGGGGMGEVYVAEQTEPIKRARASGDVRAGHRHPIGHLQPRRVSLRTINRHRIELRQRQRDSDQKAARTRPASRPVSPAR